MISINQLLTYQRKLRSNDYILLNQLLDDVEVGAFFETNDGKSIIYGFGQKQTWTEMPNATESIVFGAKSFDNQLDTGIMNGFWFEPEIIVVLEDDKLLSNLTTIDACLKKVQFKNSQPVQIVEEHNENDWSSRVQSLINELKKQESIQKVVFGRQQQLQFSNTLSLTTLVPVLRKQKNIYHVMIKKGHELFITATPERLIKISHDHLETAAVAGTIQRGKNESEDDAFGKILLRSKKNNEEHEYVVRSIVQQLHDVTSTLHIPTSPVLLKNKQVQHLYTPIVGRINTNVSIRNIVYKLHPTPALGGVPQQKAMDYIRNHEMMTRGLFASPVGYFTRDNIGEFVVGIRSMYVNGKNARLFAGAGIVVDSDSQQEFYETSLKFQPMHELLEELSTNGCTNV